VTRGTVFFLGALLLASDASRRDPEIVMTPGSEITARTSFGTITIRAGATVPGSGERTYKTPWGPKTIPIPDKYRRTYRWGHCQGTVDLEPQNERWYGSLGISFPGPGFHWRECEGVARAVVDEGQQHFDTIAEAMRWIEQKGHEMPYVFRNDGLVVGWDTVIPERKQLNVEVWQVLIRGNRPTALPGANDAAIATKGLAEDGHLP
jgi:hypothetical protein